MGQTTRPCTVMYSSIPFSYSPLPRSFPKHTVTQQSFPYLRTSLFRWEDKDYFTVNMYCVVASIDNILTRMEIDPRHIHPHTYDR